MTEEEYDLAISELKKKHADELSHVKREYAMSNNPFKIGDIVVGDYERIAIDKIRWSDSLFGERPCCAYSGTRLTRKNEPFKSRAKGTIYQDQIKSSIISRNEEE